MSNVWQASLGMLRLELVEKNVQKKFKKTLTGADIFVIVGAHTVTHNYKIK
jgi:hypothetical protein